MPLPLYHLIFAVFSFILGTCIGSFLNVCVYRLPRDLAVNKPSRSFCPHCKAEIKWQHNLPIVGWLWLRGKCAACGVAISPRYLWVELLTGCMFLAIYLKLTPDGWSLLLPWFVLISLLITATFIDFDFFIIPDEITLGGTVAGVVLSGIFPQMMNTESHLVALGWSICGAASGYGLLWAIVELGKLAFGRKKLTFSPAETFSIEQVGDQPVLKMGEESLPWLDIFSREKDRLLLTGSGLQIDGVATAATELTFYHDRLQCGEKTTPIEKVREIKGMVSQIVIPREAMGFGDVKFMAAVGAFLGWQAVLFTVPVAAVFGSIIGIGSILIGRREWSAKIPFGPYLAGGALLWMFAGPELVGWYLDRLRP